MVSKAELRKLSKERLVNMVYDLLIRVDNLVAEVQVLKEETKVLKEEAKVLRVEVQDLQEEVKRLKTPKNSGNSSLPPSHDLFRFKNQSLREKGNKKSGGQPGHKGETLLMSANPDSVIEHHPKEICPQCGKTHNNERSQIIGKRQVIDIPVIKASVIEHQIFQSICTCGYVSCGDFPSDVVAPVQYGPNLISLTAYLSSRQNIPYARLSELIKSITTISMSEGTIFNLLNKAANIVLPIYRGIKEEIAKATTVGGDETGIKVKNESYWAWTWQTILATYIVITKSRGFIRSLTHSPTDFQTQRLLVIVYLRN